MSKKAILILLTIPIFLFSAGEPEDKEFMRIAMFENDPHMQVYRKLPEWLRPDHLLIDKKIDLSSDTQVKLNTVILDFSDAVVMGRFGKVKQFTLRALEFGKEDYAFSGLDFRFDTGNVQGIFESGGLLDIALISRDGEKLMLMEGSAIKVRYPVDKGMGRTAENMKIFSYDETGSKWVMESTPGIIKNAEGTYYTFDLTHFSFWNIDAPITEHSCLRGILKIEGTEQPRVVTITAEGLDYRGTTRVIATNGYPFSLDVKRDSTVSIMAYTKEKDGVYYHRIKTGKQMSTGKKVIIETFVEINNTPDLLGCMTNRTIYTNSWKPSEMIHQGGSSGGFVLRIYSNQNELYKYEGRTYTNMRVWTQTRAPFTNYTWVTNNHEAYLYSDRLQAEWGRVINNESAGNYISDLGTGKWIGYYYALVGLDSQPWKTPGKCKDLGTVTLSKEGYKRLMDVYKEKKAKAGK